MERVSDRQRAIIAASTAFALWRDPGGDGPTLLAAGRAPAQAPVFGGADPAGRPSFCMARFDTSDANTAWHIAGDVIDGPAGLSVAPGAEALRAGAPGPVHAPQDDVPPPAPVARAAYEARVARVTHRIRAGQATKVVMSRAEPVPVAGRDLVDCFDALAEVYPAAFVALVSSSVTGTWLAATPETLLHADADAVRTMALAGTQWPDDLDDLSRIAWPEKIVSEQAIVAGEIRETFRSAGIAEMSETPARTVRAANLCHLRSDFRAPPQSDATLATLLRQLHPTSAVCGMPRDAARRVIAEEEAGSRGFYTGYLGPCGVEGATRLYVNLRSARVAGDTAFLHVGGGIVAASDPALEWQETVEKARVIHRVL